MPEVSDLPSKTLTLNPNFWMSGVTLSSYYCAFRPTPSCSGRRSGEASGTQPPIQVRPGGESLAWEILGRMPRFLRPSPKAGLRRSFRLGRRERLGSPQEGKVSSVAESPELLTYEEVTRYQHQPGERPRLVVLIGR